MTRPKAAIRSQVRGRSSAAVGALSGAAAPVSSRTRRAATSATAAGSASQASAARQSPVVPASTGVNWAPSAPPAIIVPE